MCSTYLNHYQFQSLDVVGSLIMRMWWNIFLAGASAVQLGSCLYYGYEIITQIRDNLIRYLDTQKLDTISQLTGLAHKYEEIGFND